MEQKRYTIVLLRWVLIIASAYLMLFRSESPAVDSLQALFVVFVLASNLVVNRFPDRWLESRAFDMGLVLFDTTWVTVTLAWTPGHSDDFFLMYFLVLFVAALGESLRTILASAVVIAGVYGWGLTRHIGLAAVDSTAFLRMVFLFVVALFYGYFVTSIRSRRRETEEAHALERAKTDLLAAVSHDLRGPLSNVENYAMMLLAGEFGPIAPEPREVIGRLQADTHRLMTLVLNCLDATRIEAGRLELQTSQLQLNDLVVEAVQLAAAQAANKRIALNTSLDPALPTIVGDITHLGRVASNLLGNALKYTPDGGAVTVRTYHDPTGVQLEVSDTGPGIPPAEQEAIFQKYERLRGSKRQPGTGLGLFIVNTIVSEHGGSVRVASTPGCGATFTVCLPFEAIRPAPAPASLPEPA